VVIWIESLEAYHRDCPLYAFERHLDRHIWRLWVLAGGFCAVEIVELDLGRRTRVEVCFRLSGRRRTEKRWMMVRRHGEELDRGGEIANDGDALTCHLMGMWI
jgi:hypothetical protein